MKKGELSFSKLAILVMAIVFLIVMGALYLALSDKGAGYLGTLLKIN